MPGSATYFGKVGDSGLQVALAAEVASFALLHISPIFNVWSHFAFVSTPQLMSDFCDS